MTGETGMSLAVTGRKRQTVQTARRLAVFQKTEAATGNKRQPVADKRYCVMYSCSVNDDRRRRRPGRLDTRRS